MRRHVFDTNALLGMFFERAFSNRIRRLVEEAAANEQFIFMSAVNWGEFRYVLLREYGEAIASQVNQKAIYLPLMVISADVTSAEQAARLHYLHKLPYADCFAAALAVERDAVLVSSDPDFKKLGGKLKFMHLHR